MSSDSRGSAPGLEHLETHLIPCSFRQPRFGSQHRSLGEPGDGLLPANTDPGNLLALQAVPEDQERREGVGA